ncbi:MFS general substrate transporter [Flagelloscypha sp. PMI_526]|nr:MFS general substrate transporter [Flagelloscypha sp. PMI_526]
MNQDSLVDENTSLLARSDSRLNADLVYTRFSPSKKRLILALICWNGLLSFFVGGVFTVSIPNIARDFGTTTDIVSWSISLCIVSGACGSLLGASNSTYYGRRPIYLIFLPVFVVGSFGVVFSTNVWEMMFFRALQAFGASPGMSVGGASIADIFPVEQRGFAMGTYMGICLLSPSVAPTLAGFAAYYGSWRTIQYILGFAGIIGFFAVFLLFPETSHPGSLGKDRAVAAGKPGVAFVNPFKALGILKSPNITFTKFGISNQVVIGLCFAPIGFGNIIGAPVAGRISDHFVVRWKERRGFWYPEDRLRASIVGALFLVPLSTLAIGIIVETIPTPLGLTLVMVGMFINGIGVDLVMTPTGAYCLDVLQNRSAEVMAATSAFRALVIGISSSFMVPMVHSIGSGWTNAVFSLVAWFGAFLLLVTIHHGQKLREFVDIGYSI